MNTNFQNIKELDKQYTPSVRGVINPVEILTIKRVLEIRDMTEVELRNLRDFVVIFYTKNEDINNFEKMIERMDKMSAITYVIDSELLDRGYEI